MEVPIFGLANSECEFLLFRCMRPTEAKLEVLHRYDRRDQEASKGQQDDSLDHGLEQKGCVVAADETREGSKATTSGWIVHERNAWW